MHERSQVSRFNPHARGGRDAAAAADVQAYAKFQSTRPRGARQGQGQTSLTISMFQSTRPRGARRSVETIRVVDPSFNPHARGGRDR